MPERSIAFDRVADRYDESRGGLRRGQVLAGSVQPHLPPGPVLEIGVGTGVIAIALVDAGRTVLGIDLSRPMLTHALARLGPRVVEADGARLPVRAGAVDGVCVVWVLSLVGDPAGLVAEAARALRPGGRVVIVGSRAAYDDDDLDPFFKRIEALRSSQDSVESVSGYAAAAGLEVAHVGITDDNPFEQSPNQLADLIEQRLLSMLWDLDDGQWQEVVVPVIEGLRALSEPDRARQKTGLSRLLVLAKP